MEMTQTLPKELQSTATVRFQDCDPFQHLNNARYIDYFLNAREDQLNEFYGFNIFQHSKTNNQGWVVTKTQIAYLFPAGVMESLLIQTRLIHMSDSLLVVEGMMFNYEQKRLKSLVWMEFAYVSTITGRIVKHSDELLSFFKDVVLDDIYQPDSFNQRLDAVKRQYRRQVTEATERTETLNQSNL